MINKINVLGLVIISLILMVVFYDARKSNKTQYIDELTGLVYEQMEYAYFEGQKDAIEQDIRIQVNDSNRWEWIKSPWDGVNDFPTKLLPMKE